MKRFPTTRRCLVLVHAASVLSGASALGTPADNPAPAPPVVFGPIADPGSQPTAAEPASTPLGPAPSQVLVVPGLSTRAYPRLETVAPPEARGLDQTPPLLGPARQPERNAMGSLGVSPGLPPGSQAPRPVEPPDLLEPITVSVAPEDAPKTRARPPLDRPVAARPAPGPTGFFGRLFQPFMPRRDDKFEDVVTVEQPGDPASEAAVKRRVERQIQESLGKRVRSAHVRVAGKRIIIAARPARFWQKRSVRNALEALPGFEGYSVDVVVED